ncbi:hypothetical protein Gorai_007647 [Gossypium raimondii]|uniref:RNase H type-1 domain-containing protein n=1 Tax=Gossypium raimondii TaxID=29730 RepID=A0A7J8Q8J5_GOSRA|nr:hypothetical protein [Gossypium raimondii]
MSVQDELWALSDGLKLVKDANIENLVVEADATSGISLICNHNISNPLLFTLILECKTLLDQFHQHQLKHTFREGNRCANAVAGLGSKFSNPPQPNSS